MVSYPIRWLEFIGLGLGQEIIGQTDISVSINYPYSRIIVSNNSGIAIKLPGRVSQFS